MPLLPQQLRPDEVHEALAPASALNKQQPNRAIHYLPNCIILAFAEYCMTVTRANTKKLKR